MRYALKARFLLGTNRHPGGACDRPVLMSSHVRVGFSGAGSVGLETARSCDAEASLVYEPPTNVSKVIFATQNPNLGRLMHERNAPAATSGRVGRADGTEQWASLAAGWVQGGYQLAARHARRLAAVARDGR
jgi:hypothetical protein